LDENKYIYFLDSLGGYNEIKITPKDQDKTTFTCPWGTYVYKVLPLGLCNAPATLQMRLLATFTDLIDDCVKVYMDYFLVYGDTFREALDNLETILNRCREKNLSFSNAKCFMLYTEGIMLGHHVSVVGINLIQQRSQ
jgi:hypothetical protein